MADRYLAEAGRYFYTTPTMYLQLLESYLALKNTKQDEVQTKQSRYEVGLEKLLSTASQVWNPILVVFQAPRIWLLVACAISRQTDGR